MIELLHLKKLTAIDWLLITSVNLAALETIAYFYGISNISQAISKSNSLNSIEILTYFFRKNFWDSIAIFFTLFLISVASVILFREGKPIPGEHSNTYYIFDYLLKFVQIFIITYFIIRFAINTDPNSKVSIIEIIIPTIITIGLSAAFTMYLNKNLDINITLPKLLIWILWLIAAYFVFSRYIKNDFIYSLKTIEDTGYLKDFIIMATMIFLIGILPAIINYPTGKYKIWISLAIFLLIILIAIVLVFFELRFPGLYIAKDYIEGILKYNKLDEQKLYSAFGRVMEFHVIIRTGVLLAISCVLPFAIKILYEAIKTIKS